MQRVGPRKGSWDMRRSSGVRAAAALTAVIAVAGLALSTGAPASATLTADLQDLSLPVVTYSHQERTVSGRVILTVSDTAAPSESEGWQVTKQVSGLHYSGLHNGTDIPALNLAVASVEAPVAADGLSEAVDPVGGPRIPATPPAGALDGPRTVLEAQPGHGSGTYTQGIVLSLTLPLGTRTGTYTGTITTTISPHLAVPATAASAPTPDASAAPTASPDTGTTTGPEPTASPSPEPSPDAIVSSEPEPAVSTDPVP